MKTNLGMLSKLERYIEAKWVGAIAHMPKNAHCMKTAFWFRPSLWPKTPWKCAFSCELALRPFGHPNCESLNCCFLHPLFCFPFSFLCFQIGRVDFVTLWALNRCTPFPLWFLTSLIWSNHRSADTKGPANFFSSHNSAPLLFASSLLSCLTVLWQYSQSSLLSLRFSCQQHATP